MNIMRISISFLITICLSTSVVKADVNVQDIVVSINRFTFDYLSNLGDHNSIFSSYSVSASLAITYAGSSGKTEEEMAQTMYFPQKTKEFHTAFYGLNNALVKRKHEGISLHIANALWADNTTLLLDDYLTTTNEYYGAGVNRVDFINQTEKTRLKINRWIEEQTENRIKDMLEPNTITPLTRLVITNAIYFLGSWQDVFLEENTEDKSFYLTSGEEITTPFMQREGFYNYSFNDDTKIVEIPYEKKELAMVIIIPKVEHTLQELVNRLNYEEFEKNISTLTRGYISFQIPKFSFESKYNLKDLLIKLGMQKAFTDKADFSHMISSDQELQIDEIIHQAFIEVNEKGTEAAASTAVVMRTTAFQDEVKPIVFRADRPFMFFIRDTVNGAILFSGTLYDPRN